MLDQESTPLYPPLQVRAGVLTVDGFGINLHVLYGKLCVEDGIGRHRRSIALDRAGSGLERLVLLGKSGSLTLEALAWLRAIGAAIVQIGKDGTLLAHSVPFGYNGLPIRRSQALAVTSGLDVILARELIARKLEGQRRNLVRLHADDLRPFDTLRGQLDRTQSIEQVRGTEAQAAALYWSAWRGVSIRWRDRDLARIPKRWTRYDSRASVLTDAPRASTQPINSLLNYAYTLLEVESRLALLAQGLDPTLGVLHADQRNRDSFALDVIEPLRPNVDAFVLDLLEDRIFTSRDFTELPNGVCRLSASLTHDLAITLPHWRTLLQPLVARLAQTFRGALINQGALPRTYPANIRTVRRAVPASKHSPLITTPRKASQPRPYASKAWGTPRPESLAPVPIACASCGEPVAKRRRRYCEACLPDVRRAHVERAIATARKALAAQARQGPDPRSTPSANVARGEANAEHHRRNRQWQLENGQDKSSRDRAWFLRDVTPKLEAFALAEIANATGLSLAACSRFRAGTRVPHPRHWEAFERLIVGPRFRPAQAR
jgi:CRISPR-associated endonuclease Cas1